MLKLKNLLYTFLKQKYFITFIDRDGTIKKVQFKQGLYLSSGQHILQVAKQNQIDLEGACQASLACSTCHVILQGKMYDSIEPPKQQEQDLLDLAYGLSPTSRLGCQVILKEEHQNQTIKVPRASRNLYVDGTKPAKH